MKDGKSKKAITIKNLSFKYDKEYILKDFSLEFEEGKITTIMAPSGYGKTTILKVIAGIEKKYEGEIIYNLENPRFSMVFQEDRLVENISVLKNIKMVSDKLCENDIIDELNKLNIGQYANTLVRNMSGGEKRRVAIVRAMLAEYDILLLDEPFTGLDEETKEVTKRYVRNKGKNRTIILVTHDVADAEFFGCI